MSSIKNSYQIDANKIVIFGAGKIGRSFIGQLFGGGGYKVVFVDVDQNIIDRLNNRGSYRVVIKGEKSQEIIVKNVQAIFALDKQMVIEAVSTAGILAVSVGKNALEKVIPVIANGLEIRYTRNPGVPLDIIIAENMRAAGDFMKEQLKKNLPLNYPIEKLVGLIETSIGKMVPIMTLAELEKDPLMVYAEPYNTLILDRKGFKSDIPDIEGLAPKDNIKAWVDRKSFIHNLGHATAAYFGYYKHPEAIYLFEILDYKEVYSFTREVMIQSAVTLNLAYPDDYTFADLKDHINDLLKRFRNKALKDTIFRVGSDLTRKLRSGDRFIGALRLAIHMGTPYDKILKAMSYGLFFRANDERGNLFPSDHKFLEALSSEFDAVLIKELALDPVGDRFIIDELKSRYEELGRDLKT